MTKNVTSNSICRDLTPEEKRRWEAIIGAVENLATQIVANLPSSDNQKEALAHLKQCQKSANTSIAMDKWESSK